MSAEIPCRPWVEHLRAHLPVADAGEDPEGVHQVRVAAARLRVWLRLGERRVLSDDLRWLRRSAGEVRDLDVLIGMGGPAEFVESLRERWRAARGPWLAALRSARTRALLQAFELAPPIDRRRAGKRTRRWLRRLRKVGDRLDLTGAPEEEVHAFRRRARRCRYALEWLDTPDPRVKDLAKRMGDLNDLFVLRRWAALGLLPPGAAPCPEELGTRIQTRRAELAREWPDLSRGLAEAGW